MVHDPHRRDAPLFECMDCGRRVSGEVDDRLCSNCGGPMQNIGVTRAE
jgi:Zn finger protein HypA/HybF involved in hydrogenase expression